MHRVVRVALVLACGVPSSSLNAIAGSCGQEPVLGAKRLEGTTPVPVCTAVDQATLQSIESGEGRLVLVLSEYRPSESDPEALLSVTMPDGHEQVLGIFPVRAFTREATDSHRRFLLTSLANAVELEPTAPVCVAVKLASPGGVALLELETWTPEK